MNYDEDDLAVERPFRYRCRSCGFTFEGRPMTCSVCGGTELQFDEANWAPIRTLVEDQLVSRAKGGFWACKYPVTQILWRLVMGFNPSRFRGDSLPVESVNIDDCRQFIARLNALPLIKKAKVRFRLPCVDEWARIGRRGRYPFDEVAWSWRNSGGRTHPVGLLKPSPKDIFDLFGNVWEWCAPGCSNEAACCGGCWCCDEAGSLAVERWPVETRRSFIGFRLIADRK